MSAGESLTVRITRQETRSELIERETMKRIRSIEIALSTLVRRDNERRGAFNAGRVMILIIAIVAGISGGAAPHIIEFFSKLAGP